VADQIIEVPQGHSAVEAAQGYSLIAMCVCEWRGVAMGVRIKVGAVLEQRTYRAHQMRAGKGRGAE
jgi:hypothetical protein